MRDVEEIRKVLKMLKEKYIECYKELSKIKRGEKPDLSKCEVMIGEYAVTTDFDHDGIGEWIKALRWVLREE